MEYTHYFKNAYVYIHFYNGNYDAYENVHELTFIDDLVKIVVKNEDGSFYADYYDRYIISLIRIIEDLKEN